MAHHVYKEEAKRYVEELLQIVRQLDGPDKAREVRTSIQEAGRVSGRVAGLVSELTTNYAPERKDRWEEIIRKTDEARRASMPPAVGAQRPVPTAQHAAIGHPPPPAGGRVGGPVQPTAATPPAMVAGQPARPPYSYGPPQSSSNAAPMQAKAPYSTQQAAGIARPVQPVHPSQQPPAQQQQAYLQPGAPGHPSSGAVAPAPFPHAPGGNPAGIRPTAGSNCEACRGKHKKHACIPAKDVSPIAGVEGVRVTAKPPALTASAPHPGSAAGADPRLGRPTPGPGGMVPTMHAGHSMGPGPVGMKRARDDGDGADEGALRAAALHHMPPADKLDAHINRIYRNFALRSMETVRKERRGVALDPRRLPDAAVRALLRRAW